MKNHDYKAALKFFNSTCKTHQLIQENHPAWETIRHALLLADKVTGEPSDEMINKAWFPVKDSEYDPQYADAFKAMIQQAEREIG